MLSVQDDYVGTGHLPGKFPEMGSEQLTCEHCGNTFPDSRNNCPHCAKPQIFPNVSKANSVLHKSRLDERFNRKRQECEADGRADVFERFQTAAAGSHALFACPLLKLHREVASGTEIFETYYQLEELRLRGTLFGQLDWERLRPQAEIELLGSHHHIENLHYACLSIDWDALSSYGDCIVRLDEQMIAHRASCFEGNTAVIFFVYGNFDHYLRSSWSDRGKLAATVFADQLQSGISDSEFPKILVSPGVDAVDDAFIEVHVFGTLTARSFSEVRFSDRCSGPRESVYRDAIIEKMKAASESRTRTGSVS